MNKEKQLALGCLNYATTMKELPPGADHVSQLSWLCFILPYIEQQALYDQLQSQGAFEFGQVKEVNGNRGTHDAHVVALNQVDAFFCPSMDVQIAWKPSSRIPATTGERTYTSHYVGVAGPIDPGAAYNSVEQRHGFKRYLSTKPDTSGVIALSGPLSLLGPLPLRRITDGTSKTIMIGEISMSLNTVSIVIPGQSNVPRSTPGDAWVDGMTNNGKKSEQLLPLEHSDKFPQDYYTPMVKGIDRPINTPFINPSLLWPFQSNHPGGVNFARCDGSVEFTSQDIDFTVYQGLANYNGGE